MAAGNAFAWMFSLARVPQLLTATLLGPDAGPIKILVIASIFFFVACMFVDQLVAIIILAPMFVGPALAAGIDPIHLGIIVTAQCAIGSVTPPFGCNIFTASAVFHKSYMTVIRKILPYFVMYFIISILMIMFPKSMTSEAVSRKLPVRSVSSVPNWTRTSWQNCSVNKLPERILQAAG